MAVRIANILSSRARSRTSQTARGRRPDRGRCRACGREIVADDHAVQLAAGLFHAGCVLYGRREVPAPPPGVGRRLQATR